MAGALAVELLISVLQHPKGSVCLNHISLCIVSVFVWSDSILLMFLFIGHIEKCVKFDIPCNMNNMNYGERKIM